MTTKFIVMEAASATPASWKWSGGPRGYRRIALVEVDPKMVGRPKMISPRAKGVVRILEIWDRLYEGKTEKCEYRQTLSYARRLAAILNGDLVANADEAADLDRYLIRGEVKKPPG